jgi:hypothetical protein
MSSNKLRETFVANNHNHYHCNNRKPQKTNELILSKKDRDDIIMQNLAEKISRILNGFINSYVENTDDKNIYNNPNGKINLKYNEKIKKHR